MELWLAYLIIGAIAGLLAGLLGIGGGLVIVPALSTLFAMQGFSEANIMHMAIGTSLATIIFTGSSSVLSHYKHGNLDIDIAQKILPGVVLGSIIGPLLAHHLSSATLKLVFASFVLLIGLQMLIARTPAAHRNLPGMLGLSSYTLASGSLASILGLGGGAFLAPFLAWCNVEMKKAAALGSAMGLPISIFGTIAYISSGMNAANLPAATIGYIFWPALVGIVITSVLFAPLGAKLAHVLPNLILKRVFGVFLIGMAIKMWL